MDIGTLFTAIVGGENTRVYKSILETSEEMQVRWRYAPFTDKQHELVPIDVPVTDVVEVPLDTCASGIAATLRRRQEPVLSE